MRELEEARFRNAYRFPLHELQKWTLIREGKEREVYFSSIDLERSMNREEGRFLFFHRNNREKMDFDLPGYGNDYDEKPNDFQLLEIFFRNENALHSEKMRDSLGEQRKNSKVWNSKLAWGNVQ